MVINLIRGSPKNDSIAGIDKCGALSWSLMFGFIIFCLIVTYFNFRAVQKEFTLKQKFGKTVPSDININDQKTLAFILIMSFVGSFLGNALGLGGGFIYNPV